MDSQDKIKEDMKIGQSELYDLLTSNEVSWQAILYDLINTEQLNPWDINIGLLANRYLERIKQLEEANFIISSKVLLATSILLRIKSEILLYDYIRSIDEILFGKKEEKKTIEKIEINENDLPLLYPKTPLPRYRKVSLQELMKSLDRAISTETRRIEKETSKIQQEKSIDIMLPKMKISIRDRIRNIYAKILTAFRKKQARISYSELTGNKREEKIACFLPCLHLDTQQKLFLEQEKHFQEIWIWLYTHYRKQVETGILKEKISVEREEEIAQETGFDNPLSDFFNLVS